MVVSGSGVGSTTRAAPVLQREGVVGCSGVDLTGVCVWWWLSELELDKALVVLFTLLEKVLFLLSGLDSEPSELRTLRIVLDLAIAVL
jgi:hypothetical protein